MNLGSRLKQQLDARGLTVTQFSKNAGVPAQTIYALINRDSNKADMDIVTKLLMALQMDFFTFMGSDVPAGITATVPGQAAPVNVRQTTSNSVAGMNSEASSHTVSDSDVFSNVPKGKALLSIDHNTYEQIRALAADEGITDPLILEEAIDEYMISGLGYRQRPLRSILRDHKPQPKHSGDIDSFLL